MPDAETSTSSLHGTCYQCSLYHLDQASSPPRWGSSWVLRRDGEKTPGSRFVKPPCVIHSLTSFTCCDSFSFWAAGTHIALEFDFQGASPHQVHHLIRCRCIPTCPLYDTLWHRVCDPVKFMMGCINDEQELSGMYLLNRSVLNLILSLELHPMSMSCREPGIDSFPPCRNHTMCFITSCRTVTGWKRISSVAETAGYSINFEVSKSRVRPQKHQPDKCVHTEKRI